MFLVCGANLEEHNGRLRQVLGVLQDASLKLNIKKCTIAAKEVSYLGYLIDENGIHPTTDKIRAIQEAPALSNATQLRAYL